MAATLSEFMAYLGVDADDKDPMIKLCLDAAIADAKRSGIPAKLFNTYAPDLDLYIYSLAALEYDNRGLTYAATNASQAAIERRRNAMFLSLRYGGVVKNG